MVYFITDGEYTKIGYAKEVYTRLKALQTANARILTVRYVIDGNKHKEHKVHKMFEVYRAPAQNEWFKIPEGKLESILMANKITDLNFAKRKANIINTKSIGARQVLKGPPKSKKEKKAQKTKITLLLDDIRTRLAGKPHQMISYKGYQAKYGFTKEQISFYVRSARLAKDVYEFNAKVSRS